MTITELEAHELLIEEKFMSINRRLESLENKFDGMKDDLDDFKTKIMTLLLTTAFSTVIALGIALVTILSKGN